MSSDAPQIKDILAKLGLTEKESKVYFHIANSRGSQKVADISSKLRLYKTDTYRILKSLQCRGMIESTLDRPMGFIAIPFEKVLDSYIKSMSEQIFYLRTEKKKIISQSKSVALGDLPADQEKFIVLKGRERIFAKSFQMDREAKKEMLMIYTGLDEVKYDQKMEKPARRLKIRTLTHFSPEDIGKVKSLERITSKLGIKSDARHLDLDKEIPFSLQIADEESALLHLNPKNGENLTAFWTNSKVFVYLWRLLFEYLWASNTVDWRTKISEFEATQLKNASTAGTAAA